MLQNAYSIAKIGADTAENEQHFAEILPTDALSRLRPAVLMTGERSGGPPRSTTKLDANWLCLLDAFSKNAFFENAFFENFANFWRARSRLYQNEILQENNSKYAFDSIFQALQDLHPFAPLQSQNFRKNRFEKSAILVKIQQKFCKSRKICKILSNFKNFSLRIW